MSHSIMSHGPDDCRAFRREVKIHRRNILLAADIIEECQRTAGTVLPDAPTKIQKRIWDAAIRRLSKR